jgi:hypothetical protein
MDCRAEGEHSRDVFHDGATLQGRPLDFLPRRDALRSIALVALWAIPYLWVNRGLFVISVAEKP